MLMIYISFSASDSDTALSQLSTTLDATYTWLTANRLCVNPSKTDYILFGTHQQRHKITSSTLSFCGNILSPSSEVKNLGVTFDADLCFKTHISSVCCSSFYHIRQIRAARPSLDTKSTILLANALVSSKLDYRNFLYSSLPDCSIHRLQRVQNSLARAIVPTIKRSQYITPTLRALHWLPIHNASHTKLPCS